MTNLIKTNSIIVLFALLLIIISCSPADSEDNMQNAGGELTDSETTTEILQPNLPDANYDGDTFTFLVKEWDGNGYWGSYEIYAEKEDGDAINDAVYRRNRAIEERLNITIKEVRSGDVGEFTRKSVTADDAEYMYLRSLMGPENIMYKLYDEPDLIHDCMKTWFELADRVTAEHQKYVTIDELLLDEDICYKNGSLISPDMMKEFLFPYYQQLISNMRSRQIDKSRHLFLHVATDGFVYPVIDLYKEIGMDYMSPFEVAANCDVVEVGRKYPDLRIRGGIDKRILAAGKDAIDRELDRIMPVMKKRGGYIPTCDHGVPEEVDFNNYLHYRKKMQEYKN